MRRFTRKAKSSSAAKSKKQAELVSVAQSKEPRVNGVDGRENIQPVQIPKPRIVEMYGSDTYFHFMDPETDQTEESQKPGKQSFFLKVSNSGEWQFFKESEDRSERVLLGAGPDYEGFLTGMKELSQALAMRMRLEQDNNEA